MSEEELEKQAIADVTNMVGDITIEELIKNKNFNITIYPLGIINILKVLSIVDKQQKEIKELNEKISKAIGHIEACKTTLGNYILTPNEIECLLNILRK